MAAERRKEPLISKKRALYVLGLVTSPLALLEALFPDWKKIPNIYYVSGAAALYVTIVFAYFAYFITENEKIRKPSWKSYNLRGARVTDAWAFDKIIRMFYAKSETPRTKFADWLLNLPHAFRVVEGIEGTERYTIGFYSMFSLNKSAYEDIKAGNLSYVDISRDHAMNINASNSSRDPKSKIDIYLFIVDFMTSTESMANKPAKLLEFDMIMSIISLSLSFNVKNVAFLIEDERMERLISKSGFALSDQFVDTMHLPAWKLYEASQRLLNALANPSIDRGALARNLEDEYSVDSSEMRQLLEIRASMRSAIGL